MLGICSQSQLLGLEALKAHAQVANHTLCMVVVLLLHSGEVGTLAFSFRLLRLCRRKCDFLSCELLTQAAGCAAAMLLN